MRRDVLAFDFGCGALALCEADKKAMRHDRDRMRQGAHFNTHRQVRRRRHRNRECLFVFLHPVIKEGEINGMRLRRAVGANIETAWHNCDIRRDVGNRRARVINALNANIERVGSARRKRDIKRKPERDIRSLRDRTSRSRAATKVCGVLCCVEWLARIEVGVDSGLGGKRPLFSSGWQAFGKADERAVRLNRESGASPRRINPPPIRKRIGERRRIRNRLQSHRNNLVTLHKIVFGNGCNDGHARTGSRECEDIRHRQCGRRKALRSKLR